MNDGPVGFFGWLGQALRSEAALNYASTHPEVVIIIGAFCLAFAMDTLMEAPRGIYTAAMMALRSRETTQGLAAARRLRQDSGARFAALIAPLAQDDGDLKDMLGTAMRKGMTPFLFEREVRAEPLPVRLNGVRDGALARAWLRKADADLLVWGQAGRHDRLWRIFFLTGRGRTEDEPIQEIRLIPPSDEVEAQRLANGIAYIFSRVALPCAEAADRYKPEKLTPVLDALDHLIAAPPRGLGDEFERLLRRDAAAIALSIGERVGDGDALRRASRLRVRILAEIDRARDPETWAAARAAVGRVHLAIGEREDDVRRLTAAAEAFAEAAELFEQTSLMAPKAESLAANAQAVLAQARLSGEPAEFGVAAQAHRTALTAADDAEDSRLADRARRGLGQALQGLGERNGDLDVLVEAAEQYDVAGNDNVRAIDPLNWAQTHHDRGAVLMNLAARKRDPKHYYDAITAYRTALKERTKLGDLDTWAATMTHLGHALFAVGKAEPGSGALEAAVRTYRETLENRDRASAPYEWAQVQNNLGNALQAIGERDSDREALRKAVGAYRSALEELPPERFPFEWAGTQNNLGNALHVLGEEGRDPDALEAALTAHREALSVRTKDETRVDWAATRNNMGLVLTTLGASLHDPNRLEEAVRAYRDALGVFQLAGEARYAEMAKRNLDRATQLLDQSKQIPVH